MCALTAAERGLSCCAARAEQAARQEAAHHRQGPLQRNEPLRCEDHPCQHSGRRALSLQRARTAFGPQDTMALFESLGVPLKTERGNRVFPVSDRSPRRRRRAGAPTRAPAGRSCTLRPTDILIAGRRRLRRCDRRRARSTADAAVICTGGLSYPLTGSTGDGYRFAQRLGHTVDAHACLARAAGIRRIPGAPRCRASPCAT